MDISGAHHHRTSNASSSGGGRGGSSSGHGGGGATHAVTDQAAQAAASLQLLLREDRLLQQHGLTVSGSNPDAAAFPYAAALLQEDAEDSGGSKVNKNTQQRANVALQDVERKLALVESLAVKLSRTSPEAVAGHLLRLHGYHLPKDHHQQGGAVTTSLDSTTSTTTTPTTTTTLVAIRDRADRLQRQAEVLENVARRVEGSLTRGQKRMETACTRLERVLTLSSSLKMILRLQFENSKLQGYDLEDVRDLIRAASCVAILEDLLSRPELQAVPRIAVVERLRPQVEQTAVAVRRSASTLLEEQYSQPTALQQLGATLQVYYHLGELPDAVWKAVDHAHGKAESVSRQLWNSVTLTNITEQAKRTAKEARMIQKKLKQVRAESAQEWAAGISEVAVQVRSLHRVLSRKTDPVRRQVFIDVVAAAPIPLAYAPAATNSPEFNLFSLFWGRLCNSLSSILLSVLTQDQGKLTADVAALYPAVRAAALDMIGSFQDTIPTMAFEDASAAPVAGILGGSSVLDDAFLDWTTGQEAGENPQAPASADSWTRVNDGGAGSGQRMSQRLLASSGPSAGLQTTASMSAVFQSLEWKALQGNKETSSGLYPLQKAFLEACSERLRQPLQYMFPEKVAIDDDGANAYQGLSLLPSKYDVQRFDENIRQELALADPREGGGDLTAVTMIAECVTVMIAEFCFRAKNAISGGGEDAYLADDWSATENLQHDRKLATIMHSMAGYLRNAAEKTFVAPYRPATSAQHEEAAAMCQKALVPAVQTIDNMVKSTILTPLCRAINKRIGSVLARMHLGVYLDSGGGGGGGGMEGDSPAFVEKNLTPVFEAIAANALSNLPPDYAAFVSSSIVTYSIYTFVTNASLVRPLGESARLHITQDLADLELALEQLMFKCGASVSLGQIAEGKPYAELRAVRQLLYWAGLEDKSRPAEEITKSMLREAWMKDVRPSTVLQYLFSYAPSLLSSPHHAKRMKVDDYVSSLVGLDAQPSVADGEDKAWMTVMACCDSYQQRASSASKVADGDSRVPEILMSLGQELLRRRRN